MPSDFTISQWGRWLVVNAHTDRAEAWLHNHWRNRHEPKRSRATTVFRLLSEIVWLWGHDDPGYTVQMDEGVASILTAHTRLLPFMEEDDETICPDETV